MLKIVFILLIALASVSCTQRTAIEYRDNEGPQFPFPVSIQYQEKHICSGAIIEADIVVTAARCFFTLDPDRGIIKMEPLDLKVRAGSTNWKAGGTSHDVYTCVLHEGHNLATGANDIALIQLTSSITNTKPVGLAISLPNTNEQFFFAGWKTTGYSDISSAVMLYNIMTIMTDDDCQNWLTERKNKTLGKLSFSQNTASNFCAKPDVNRKCFGDTGGALISKRKVFGISSIVGPCRYNGEPALFISISSMHSWISETLKNIRNEV